MIDTDPLRGMWLFDGLPPEERRRLAAQTREVVVGAGGWLLREGQEADSMFIVRSGRLDAIHEGPPETLIRRMRRGDVIGELALLRLGPRTASVRALRDSVLLELFRSQFETLISEQPSFAIALIRVMSDRLARGHEPALAPAPPGTIAVVRLDPAAPGQEAVHTFCEALGRAGTLARLDPSTETSDGELLALIDRAERDAQRVLLVAGDTSETAAWNSLCLREADMVLALSSGAPEPRWLVRGAALNGCELLVAGPRMPEASLASLGPRELQVVSDRARLDAALESTARRLTGNAVGLVLSGGGARALAHIGVVEELISAGIRIDRVAGASLGALLAAGVALGGEVDEFFTTVKGAALESKLTSDYAVPVYALLRGQKVRRALAGYFGELTIEELPRRFFSVSCDLIAREPVVHRTGLIRDAVYASLAIPGLFPPVATRDGRLLVDGGVRDNLPVATMARAGEGPVIASDVSGQPGFLRQTARPRLAPLTRGIRRALTSSEDALPRLGDTIVRSVAVGSTDTVAAARRHADLVIMPSVAGIGMTDWKQIEMVRDIGRRAAADALERAPDWVSSRS